MPRPSNTTARRTEIVLGLQLAMAEHGYERATIATIARAAGLTPGLVHYHFKNKQEILLALLTQLAQVWQSRAHAAQGLASGPRDRLAALIDAWLALDDSADPSAMACWVALGAEALRQPEVQTPYDAAMREVSNLLEQAVRAVLRSEDRNTQGSRRIATGVLAAIQGYLLMGVATPGVVPRGSASSTVRTLAMGAIDAQPKKVQP